MFAEKLDLRIDTSALRAITVTGEKDYTKLLEKFAGDVTGDIAPFKSFHFNVPEALIEQLPEELLKLEKPAVCVLAIPAIDSDNPIVPPHIDYRRRCAINFYLEASGEITQYYDVSDTTQVVQEFVAKKGECWLLNSEVPHGVLLLKNKPRKILTFPFSRLSYEEVKKYVAP